VEDKITGLKAGADEYLTKPIDTRELVVRVEAILNRMESLRSAIDVVAAETLVFMGVKGGVGTTTVALNIACALCRKDMNILAVELRSYYGSFTHHLALAFSGHWGEILEGSSAGINERDLAANIAKHPSGLALLNSPPAHLKEGFEQEHLSALLARLERDWDYIVLDLPSHPSDVHQPALDVADTLFLILEPAPDSVSAGKQTLDYLHSLKGGTANIGCIVVNRASLASAVTAGEIEAELGVPVIRTIPQAIDSLIASHKAGLPLVRAQPEHHASMAFKEIAAKVVDKSLATSVSIT
jgi:pilus assembly protein CpaE